MFGDIAGLADVFGAGRRAAAALRPFKSVIAAQKTDDGTVLSTLVVLIHFSQVGRRQAGPWGQNPPGAKAAALERHDWTVAACLATMYRFAIAGSPSTC